MKTIFFISMILGIIVAGCFYGVNMIAETMPKIAVVNIAKIVEKSEKVKQLREDNNKKLDELENWIEESRLKIQKEKDSAKKEQLIDQYQDIARQKEDIIKQAYYKKMQEINAEISDTIKKIAKNKKYNIILSNSVVMYGGSDITDEVCNNLPE